MNSSSQEQPCCAFTGEPATHYYISPVTGERCYVDMAYVTAHPRLSKEVKKYEMVPVGEETAEPKYKAHDLRVVSNVTREYDGGYSVELADGSVVAGPYATKPDAKQAKADFVAGREPRYAG